MIETLNFWAAQSQSEFSPKRIVDKRNQQNPRQKNFQLVLQEQSQKISFQFIMESGSEQKKFPNTLLDEMAKKNNSPQQVKRNQQNLRVMESSMGCAIQKLPLIVWGEFPVIKKRVGVTGSSLRHKQGEFFCVFNMFCNPAC